jgi:hypothetical protein
MMMEDLSAVHSVDLWAADLAGHWVENWVDSMVGQLVDLLESQ